MQSAMALGYLLLPRWLNGKESACNAGDTNSIPGLGRSLGEGNATLSSILAWKIPWREEPGRLESMGSQRVRHNWMTEHRHTYTHTHTHTHTHAPCLTPLPKDPAQLPKMKSMTPREHRNASRSQCHSSSQGPGSRLYKIPLFMGRFY